MRLEKKEIEQLAFLARLRLSEVEAEALSGQINKLLGTFEKLQELDTEGVEPTAHVIPMQNVFRADKPRPSWSREDILAGAPEATETTFVVPRIVET